MFSISKLSCLITFTIVFTNCSGLELKDYAGVHSCNKEIISDLSVSFGRLTVVNDTETVMLCAMSCQRHYKCKAAIFMKFPDLKRCLQFQLKIQTNLAYSVPTPDPNLVSMNPLSTKDIYNQLATNPYQFEPGTNPLSFPPLGQQGITMSPAFATYTFPRVTPYLFGVGQQYVYDDVNSPDFNLVSNSSFVLCKVIKFKL